MILVGLATMLLGAKEISQPDQLTSYAAWSSLGLGVIIVLAGAAHFRAPHKAFLLSIPILFTFIVHIYSIGLFYNVQNLQLFVWGHIGVILLILVLSYLGYKRRRTV